MAKQFEYSLARKKNALQNEQVIGTMVHHIDHMFIGLSPMNIFQ